MSTAARRLFRIVLVSSLVVISISFGILNSAWAERPVVQLTEEVKASLRTKAGVPTELVTRVDLLMLPSNPHWNVAPFAEFGWDFDNSDIARVELGAEVGVKPFSWWNEVLSKYWYSRPLTWFYVGQSFYERWQGTEITTDSAHDADKIKSVFPTNAHPEWESRFLFDIPTRLSIRSHPIGFYIMDEYIYDLRQGRTLRNEAAGGIKIGLLRQHDVELFFGWRHVDLVHLNDTDQLEGGLKAKF